jgi:predicted MFS family arabinose efflux permease
MAQEIRRATAVLAVTQVIGWGSTFYLPGVISRTMATDIGVSPEFIFGGVTIMLVVSGLISPALGRLLDRHGAAPFLTLGSLLTGVSIGLLALVAGPVSYALVWLALGFSTTLALTLPSFTAIAQLAGHNARQSMIVLMLITGLASSIAWPITVWLEALMGWRWMCVLYAAVNVLVCAPLHGWVLPRRRAMGGGAGSGTAAPPVVKPSGFRPVVLAMMAAFACSGFVSWGLSLHIVELLRDVGMSPSLALTLGSAMGALQVLARLVEFMLGRRVSPIGSAVFAAVVMTLSFALIGATKGSVAGATAFILIYSVGSGLLGVTRVALPLWVFGSAIYGSYLGKIAPVQNFSFAVAPLVFSIVTERFGVSAGILMAGVLAALAAVAMAVIGLIIRRHRADA